MPKVEVKDCSFYIMQAKFKIPPPKKKIWIGPLYQKDKAPRKIYREIWSLNLLPTEKIEKRFYIIKEVNNMSNNILLKTFCNYLEKLLCYLAKTIQLMFAAYIKRTYNKKVHQFLHCKKN